MTLDDQRDSWGDRLVLDQLGPADHPTRAPLQAPEHRLPRVCVWVLQDPGRLQDGVDRGWLQGLVLRGEGIDARRNNGQARPIQPLPAVGGAGEHVGVRLLDSGPQEHPCRPGQVVGLVGADMAAPDHRCPLPLEGGHQPGGLGVMQEDDVAGLDPLLQLSKRLFQSLAVASSCRLVQLAPVAGLAVEQVMEAFGDRKELVVALEHHPAGVDAGTSQVAEQEVEHLGDPAALLGGVHVPQPPATQPLGRHLQATQETAAGVGVKHGLEPSRVKPSYLNVLQGHRSPSTSPAAERGG